MKISFASLVFGFIAVGAAALAFYEYRELADLRAQGVSADERAQLQKSVWDGKKEIARLQGQLAAAHVIKTTDDDVKPGADNRAVLGQIASDYLARLDDPEVRKLMDIQRLANINRQYGQFYRDAKLTPAQVQQFQQLMLERQRTETDVLTAATQQGINPMSDPQEFRQMVREAQGEVDKQIATALGTDGQSELTSYQQAQSQRNVANQVAQDLSFTATPLSDTQKQQLVGVIAATNKPGGGTISDQTITQAQGFLAPGQVQALQNLQQLQQVNGQLGRLMGNRPGG